MSRTAIFEHSLEIAKRSCLRRAKVLSEWANNISWNAVQISFSKISQGESRLQTCLTAPS